MDYPGKVITKNQVTPTQTSASGNWTLDDAAAATKNNTWPVAGVPNPISKSLRFNSADSAYLNRTPASASNRKTWTWSGWVKRSALGAASFIFGANSGVAVDGGITFTDADVIGCSFDGNTYNKYTTAVFRDVSAWYHIVVTINTDEATAANRIRIYVNGVEQTAYTTQNSGLPPLGYTPNYINNANQHSIGRLSGYASYYFNGYLTEINFIDGQALTPSSFGMTNPQTGQWIPKKYTGTYGTNGFYLNFKDATSTTTLGYDYSGNANNWTTNNFSVTAGSGNDSLTDVPTPWVAYNTTGDVGGVVRGNYATLNPLAVTATLSNGNLDCSGTSTTASAANIAFPTSGKWYCEIQITSTPENNTNELVAINNNISLTGNVGRAYASNGQYYNGSAWVSFGSAWSQNDVIGIAADIDSSQLSFYKNGTLQGSAQSFSFPSLSGFGLRTRASGTSTFVTNFGQRPFAYTPPAGFLSLCSTNLPTPTISNGALYMAATTYTGNGTYPTTITNGGNNTIGTTFKPDLVWVKVRSNTYDHILYDSVRGTGTGASLVSNSTSAEGANSAYANLTAFASNGFTVGSVTAATNVLNQSSQTFVAWQWQAGQGTTSSNTSGTITSTVSANTTAGFSIVTYTGNNVAGATIGHGLGVTPSMIIVKKRSATGDWPVYHSSIGNTGAVYLDATLATQTLTGVWNNTSPTSTVFSVGGASASGSGDVNGNGATYVAYCFAAVAGYSAFGSYTGNGSTDGPFVYTGFRPRWVMFKKTSATSNWSILDTSRDDFNVSDNPLLPNTSGAESTSTSISGAFADILSNGFKLRGNSGDINDSGATYIYAAFAESPFKFANAR